jgi:heme/copper-type cytochrome/quinol oxidase subunit 4
MWGTLTFARKGHPGRAARIEFSAYALITLFITFVIAWFDFCRGGTAVRYTADFAFILAMMTGVVFMRTLSVPSGRKTLYGIIMAALIVTPVLIFLSYLPLYNSNLHFIYPDIVEKTEDFFLFWR